MKRTAVTIAGIVRKRRETRSQPLRSDFGRLGGSNGAGEDTLLIEHGFQLHRASRVEVLTDALSTLLTATRPADALVPREVVVAHPGLGRWLRQALAERRGIVANLELLLPWQFVGRLQDCVLGASAADPRYERETLRWLLYSLLGTAAPAELRGYLDGPAPQRRRFQLADRLAAVYTQYLVYRRDWLAAWEAGATPHWQAALWQRVQARAGGPHRAARMQALLTALAAPAVTLAAAAPLAVFGVNQLAPDTLAVLQALAAQRAVHLFLADPCFEPWDDIVTERRLMAAGTEAAALHLETGHPLLAAWGSQGQAFARQLQTAAAADWPQALDAELAPAPTLLGQLQQSIRLRDPSVLAAADPADGSLRVHACHTRLRELEVLRDALLGALADADRATATGDGDARLSPRDIVVMAPDLDAYAPLIPAVFGTAGYAAALPYHVADQPLRAIHPLFAAFQAVLDLADARLGVSAVLDLLDVPALTRRFGLDAAQRATLARWIARSHIAWGLDEHDRVAAGAPAAHTHTFAFGLDRMTLGYLNGGDSPTHAGILPLPGVEGLAAECVGAFAALLGTLARLRDEHTVARPPAAWIDLLLRLLDSLFAPDPEDPGEAAALDALQAALAALAEQAGSAGCDEAIGWDALREALDGELAARPPRQRFLAGGITFCGMVPFRSIPFGIVAVLGLDDGAFPRRADDTGLNLMAAHWRAGDRDTREEDRYLFLEALMSARQRLHLSYIGEGVRDGRVRNPAAPLAELLRLLQTQWPQAPWLLRHPLQPFDRRYFDGSDARLFSYARPPEAAGVLAPAPRRAPVPAHAEPVRIGDLEAFLSHPARWYFRQRLQLRLPDDRSERPSDVEPLALQLPPQAGVEATLFAAALATRDEPSATVPPWLALSGLLPCGARGEDAYAQARNSVADVLAALRQVAPDLRGAPQAVAIDLDLGDGLRLTGTIADAYPTQRVLLLANGRTLRAPRALILLLRGCALAAGGDAPWRALILPKPAGLRSELALPQTDAARALLRQWLTLYRDAAATPPLLFPATAWAYVGARANGVAAACAAARQAWLPSRDGHFAESLDPYHALAARDRDFLDPDGADHAAFAAQAEAAFAPLLAAGAASAPSARAPA